MNVCMYVCICRQYFLTENYLFYCILNFGWNMAYCRLADDIASAFNSEWMAHAAWRPTLRHTFRHYNFCARLVVLRQVIIHGISISVTQRFASAVSWSSTSNTHTSITICDLVATAPTASQSEIGNLTNSYVLINTALVETHRKFVSKISPTLCINYWYVCACVCVCERLNINLSATLHATSPCSRVCLLHQFSLPLPLTDASPPLASL